MRMEHFVLLGYKKVKQLRLITFAIVGPEGTDVTPLLKQKSSKPKKAKAEDAGADKKEEKKEAATSKAAESTDYSRIEASPLAKELATEKGIDLSQVTGSAENGRKYKKGCRELHAICCTSSGAGG